MQDRIEKVANLIKKSEDAISRHRQLKEIKSLVEFLNNELGDRVKHAIDNKYGFNNLEQVVDLEFDLVGALKTIKDLESKLEYFIKNLKPTIEFLKKRGV